MLTNTDAVIAGTKPPFCFHKALSGTLVAGRPFSYWASLGRPGAGTFPGVGQIAGVELNGHIDGQIPTPYTGDVQLMTMSAASGVAGSVQLCDRLWHNGGITTNILTSQTINSVAWPLRDDTGTTNGVGVVLGLEVSATTGANAPTITVTYTNSSGTAGRTAGFIVATAASSLLGTFYPIALQSGDVGVQSVQSLQFGGTAWASGTVHLVAYRVLGTVICVNGNTPNDISLTNGAGSLMSIAAAGRSVPFFLLTPQTTTSARIFGHVQQVVS